MSFGVYGTNQDFNANKMKIDDILGRKSSPAPKSAEEEYYINDENKLVHILNGNETLEGLSIKYNVKLNDLKKENRLWSRNDIFTRKELVIPVDIESYKMHIHEKEKEREIEIQHKNRLVEQFCQEAECDQDAARHYLGQFSFNFERSIERYILEKSQMNSPKKGTKIHYHTLHDDDSEDQFIMLDIEPHESKVHKKKQKELEDFYDSFYDL